MNVRVRSMGGAVEESMAGITGLEGLSWTHEAWDTLDRCGAGQGRRQPGIQREGVGYLTHAGVNRRRAIEGQHGGVMKLHGAGIHFFLPTPFSSAVLKPDLEKTQLFTFKTVLQLIIAKITPVHWEDIICLPEPFPYTSRPQFHFSHFAYLTYLVN